jgi:spermidine synthase
VTKERQIPHSLSQRRICLILFLVGAFSQIGQVLIFREIMAVSHSAEAFFGVILGCGLWWASLGAAVGGFLFRQNTQQSWIKPENLLVKSALVGGPLVALQILLIRYVAVWQGEVPVQILPIFSIIVTTFFCTLPHAFLSGLQFSLAIFSIGRKSFGVLYQTEAWGAVLGGLIISLILVSLGPPVQIVLFCGAFLCALTAVIARPGGPLAARFLLFTITFPLLILGASFAPIDRWSGEILWKKKLSGHRLEQVMESPHGRIAVLRHAASGQVTVFLSGGIVGRIESKETDYAWRQLATILSCQKPPPARALLVGGSLGRLPQYLLNLGVESLSIAELEREFFKIAAENGIDYTRDERIQTVVEDARKAIVNIPPDFYDLVVVISPEPDNSLSNRFCTREFFEAAYRILNQDGVLCILLPAFGSSPEYVSSHLARRTGSILLALDSIFPDTLAAPIFGHLLIAGKRKDQITLDPNILATRFRSTPYQRPVIEIEKGSSVFPSVVNDESLPDYFSAIFGGVLAKGMSFLGEGKSQVVRENFEKVIRDSNVAANLDDRPSAVFYSLELLKSIADRKISGPTENTSSLMESIELYIFFLPFLFFLCATLTIASFSARKSRNRASMIAERCGLFLCAFTTGIFGMACEVSLITLYQNKSGYVYSEIGILTAIFMAGLALGALISGYLKENKRCIRMNPSLFLAGVLAAMTVLCLNIPAMIHKLSGFGAGAGARLAVGFAILAAGFLDGATFPLLLARARRLGHEKTGSFLYAADLSGACMGASFTGIISIPAIGIPRTLQFTALFIAVTVFALIPLRQNRE